MGELRRLLELLREDGSDDVGSGSPLPGLAQLDTTINSVRSSGVAVTLEVSGSPAGWTPASTWLRTGSSRRR